MMSNHDDRPRANGPLLGVGAAILMVACCALTVLIAGGVLAGLGGFLRNPWVIGAGITVAVLALLAAARRRGRRDSTDHGCCPPVKTTDPTQMQDDPRGKVLASFRDRSRSRPETRRSQ